MNILALDVSYNNEKKTGSAACVMFEGWRATVPDHYLTMQFCEVADYEPGAFWKRELPLLLDLIDYIQNDNWPAIDLVIVDGYVDLEQGRPGLGRILFEKLGRTIPVVGIAKSKYVAAVAIDVFRGESKRPLIVTSAGTPVEDVAMKVFYMDGKYRIPTMLKHVDRLTRHPMECLLVRSELAKT